MNKKFILDACCGGKMMWNNKNHPNTIYIDIRKENKGFCGENSHNSYLEVNPDIIMDFRKMSFPDKSFRLIVCDMPHMKSLGKTSQFRKIFGCLDKDTWQEDIKQGFKEMFRVLEDYGVLLFKWNDCEISSKEVLKLSEYPYLIRNEFSSRMKTDKRTSWFCFMKIPEEKEMKGK